MTITFLEFVNLMQESADKQKKINEIEKEIKSLEQYMKNQEQSHDMYHTKGSYTQDSQKLSSLKSQLKTLKPEAPQKDNPNDPYKKDHSKDNEQASKLKTIAREQAKKFADANSPIKEYPGDEMKTRASHGNNRRTYEKKVDEIYKKLWTEYKNKQ